MVHLPKVPFYPEEPGDDLERIYQQLRWELMRGKFEATAAIPFRPLAAFIIELPPPPPIS